MRRAIAVLVVTSWLSASLHRVGAQPVRGPAQRDPFQPEARNTPNAPSTTKIPVPIAATR